jgi:phosphoribosyl 1,2-cyclic phosphodiesterase
VKVSVLGSGSSGNCTLIATENTCILVDLGFGPRSLKRRLQEAELQSTKIDAILLTHGHCDHFSGIPSFLSRNQVPIFMNEGTREEVPDLQKIDGWESFGSGSPFSVGDLQIEAFAVSHDAAEPVGFRFSSQGISGALTTDVGELTTSVIENLSGCDWLILESNHDEQMLRVGPYPWSVKQRVLSRLGHLSNQDLSTFLTHSFDRQAAHIFLAHLSRHNNHPKVALDHATKALSQPFPLYAKSSRLHLTHQSKPSIVLDL